ncbi:50S ribosomal protein L24 [Streptobacillus moniliformis]|uniref:Large ribosomal subunit protein uL24 n=1 Tax=Streptobacillus moniliformis (strain ATCC 14647 / DSM 12112 / NCTC 10651 / 9901) TaxID=519441 RepID=D1AVG7_STRM9|nr:50S ribosomal protein L24 [Streptobacillus moniliformis]ACZ01727.1 ribosomal protein L24 [Streptobacillus moniliformis DSM 12112]AVL43280.1 50S ribosomal protein L24 [Streptobacillus moniliformis]QXW66394.1 50S ribosomal protein L24 [Streptobacillus moniliformis]SQA13091.1 50S ribosomal protein L24 [Streptobacillus moniliformis]SQA14676.1 50S ribosomal protein L24 [Streptobacillus moniliformis]
MIKSKIKSVPKKLHVKTGDTVVVISGRSNNDKRSNKSSQMGDKGKIGKVLKVFPKLGKIVVEGVNLKKKHLKPNAMNTQGEIVEREVPIFSSKVMLWDESVKSATRVRYEIKDGKKVRISVKSGQEI